MNINNIIIWDYRWMLEKTGAKNAVAYIQPFRQTKKSEVLCRPKESSPSYAELLMLCHKQTVKADCTWCDAPCWTQSAGVLPMEHIMIFLYKP